MDWSPSSLASEAKSKTNQFAAKTANAIKEGIASNEAIQSVIGSGNWTSRTQGVYKFPLTLDDSQHLSRLVFNATDAIEGNEADGGRSKVFGNYKYLKYRTIGSVFLYMPEIETSYIQNFNDDGRGLLWQLNNAIQSNGGYGQLIGPGGEAALKTLGGEIANNVAPGVVKDFFRSVKNQHNSANFTGTQLRRQKFSYELRPRNAAELQQVGGLIQFFKANSATTLQQGDYMRVPSRWVIEEMVSSTSARYLPPFRFGPAFLTEVTVDYTPDGSWKTFGNGDPIAIKLDLEFIEITIVTREDIQDLQM